MPLRLAFVDFWPDFDPKHNIFVSAIRHQLPEQSILIVDSDENYDICFCSVFGRERLGHRRRVMYLGENIRPDYSQCEASLSCDYESYSGRNEYLPLWLLEVDFFRDNPKTVLSFPGYEELCSKPEVPDSYACRSNRVCAIFNNRDLGRINMLESIKETNMLDGYGRYFGRSFPPGARSKIKLLQGYKFHFCTENSYWPGYVTEKLLHAKIAGCIPIYDSRNDVAGHFNANSFIDLRNVDSSSLPKVIEALLMDPSGQESFLSEPLFHCLPYSPDDVASIITKVALRALLHD